MFRFASDRTTKETISDFLWSFSDCDKLAVELEKYVYKNKMGKRSPSNILSFKDGTILGKYERFLVDFVIDEKEEENERKFKFNFCYSNDLKISKFKRRLIKCLEQRYKRFDLKKLRFYVDANFKITKEKELSFPVSVDLSHLESFIDKIRFIVDHPSNVTLQEYLKKEVESIDENLSTLVPRFVLDSFQIQMFKWLGERNDTPYTKKNFEEFMKAIIIDFQVHFSLSGLFELL